MSWLEEVGEALGGKTLPLAVFMLAAVVTLLNLVFRYAKANIGQYSFHQIGGWQTFFIKNFDSVTYDSTLIIHVYAEGLEHVVVHAGPACRRAPEQIASDVVEIVFAEVPADASFVIRARAGGRPIALTIPATSPLQSRSFHRPMLATTLKRDFVRYLVRYLVGAASMIGVFWFGLRSRTDELSAADYALIGAAVLLSVFSFWLVAPLEGKSAVAGYGGWGDAGRSWRYLAAVKAGRIEHVDEHPHR